MTSKRLRSPRRTAADFPGESDPLWYKDAILYEVRIGAYQDSDGDGIGDIRGLTSRLDYLQDLGVTALWLLPFYPSPQRDDGYDISNYTEIHPDVGTVDDFRVLLREAHRRGLRVVTELVINHTSEQHPWFQRARRAPPGSRWRDFYVWSDTPERYPEARVIFKDFEPSNWTWDPVAKAYYWHRFYAHQPDLNFESPDVRKAAFRFMDFWLGLGVDGLRLDAIPYLFERDGTNCENLDETHSFLRELRGHVDARYRDRMLLAEANQWPEDAVAYFGKGDECHMAFHFPVMPRLFMALYMEDRYPIIDILQQTPAIPDVCQWALFLRNHDELTLEMVTEEERDYMNRVYAHDLRSRINLGIRRRLAPLLGNDRRRIELMNALLFSLPGTPVIYYGDEIGMGDNFYLGDRNGVRTPMQWSSDRNAGFSRANPQRLCLPVVIDPEYHYGSVNVEAQSANRHSLLYWMKRMIALRKRHKAFGRGSMEILTPSNRKVVAFLRSYEDERILVVVNLSRFAEFVELDLSAFQGMVAVEMFGRKPFPPIGELPYPLALGPHSFYWFSIESANRVEGAVAAMLAPAETPSLRVRGAWHALVAGERGVLEAALPTILRGRRWFDGKASAIKSVSLIDAAEISTNGVQSAFALVQVELASGSADTYALHLGFSSGGRADELRRHHPQAVLAELECSHDDGRVAGVLHEAVEQEAFGWQLLDVMSRRRSIRGRVGTVSGGATRALRELRVKDDAELRPTPLRVEQSNISIAYGNRMVLKLFRRIGEGMSPDLEIGRFLTERTSFSHIAPVTGWLEHVTARGEPATLGILQGFIANEGDAWEYALEQVSQYFERALVHPERDRLEVPVASVFELVEQPLPALASEMLGSSLEMARVIGLRTGELHVALASDRTDPAFAPERFGAHYQRSLYQSMRNVARRAFALLHEREQSLPEAVRPDTVRLFGVETQILDEMRWLVGRRLDGMRIRCHGDYHLGQVLDTGNDFAIIDFEGEPTRSFLERRRKRSPLLDVAGMLRSFDYAVQGWLEKAERDGALRPVERRMLSPWAAFWRQWVGSAFVRGYLGVVGDTGLIPAARDDRERLLRALLLEKASHELSYELNHRPDWVSIPIRGLLSLAGSPG